MEKNLKNLLTIALSLGVLALGYAALNYVNFYGKMIQPSSFRSFTVTGEGKITAIPDVAQFNFQVITEGGKDVTGLQAKNIAAVNKVIAFVKAQGVAEKDIKTQYYNINPRYETYDCRPTPILYNTSETPPAVGTAASTGAQVCPPPAISGYAINQSVNVKIRDFAKIGDIMGGVVTNGANQVDSLSFTIDDQTAVQNQARNEAIVKAQDKAKSMAKAGGFHLGRLLSIQEGSTSPIYNAYGNAGIEMLSAKDAAAAPVIQPGSQEVNLTVTLQYEIE